MQFAPRSTSIVHPLALASIALFLAAFCSCGTGQAAQEAVSFDAQKAWKHLENLVALGDRSLGKPGLEKTRVYLEEQLRAIGYEPRRETFSDRTPLRGEVEFANIMVELPAGPDAPLVILMTHFDTKCFEAPGAPRNTTFQGANDGGSGTAVLLELARVLKHSKAPRSVSYRFLFLDGEEASLWNWAGTDNTYGSRYHVQQLVETGQLKRVGAAVLLDMVGDKSLKLNRDGNSTRELVKIFFDAARAEGLGKHVGGPTKLIEDDHRPFMAQGIPSVDLIDFSYGPGNRYWHDEKDNLDNCSKESLDAIGKIVIAGLPGVEKFVKNNRE